VCLNQKILKRAVTAEPLIRILCVRDHITLRIMPRSIDRIVSWHVMLVSNPLTQISLPFVQHTSPLLVGISAFDGIGNAQMVTWNNFQTMRKQYNRLISAVWRSGAE